MSLLCRLLALLVSGSTELVASMIGIFLFFGGIRLLVLVLHLHLLLLHRSRLLLAFLVLALLASLRSEMCEMCDLLLLFIRQFLPLVNQVPPILNFDILVPGYEAEATPRRSDRESLCCF